MPWTSVTFLQDTDAEGVGTLTSTFTDEDGQIFVFSERADQSSKDEEGTYVSKAKEALAVWQKQKAIKNEETSGVLSLLNS